MKPSFLWVFLHRLIRSSLTLGAGLRGGFLTLLSFVDSVMAML